MTTRKTTVAAPVAPATFVIANGKPVDVNVHDVALDTLVEEMVASELSSYGSHIRIAAKLNDMFPFAWFDLAPQDKGDDAKAFAPAWKAVYDGFKRAGHSNPSVPGKRIKEYGRNIRAGLSPNGKTLANGEAIPGEGAGEGANPAKRSDTLFAVEESVKLWKRTNKSDKPELVAFAADLAAAMKKHLGIDVRTVK